jgi:hypothetical protein
MPVFHVIHGERAELAGEMPDVMEQRRRDDDLRLAGILGELRPAACARPW